MNREHSTTDCGAGVKKFLHFSEIVHMYDEGRSTGAEMCAESHLRPRREEEETEAGSSVRRAGTIR